MSTKTIAVLLSTFNGERYVPEQLQSLWNQTCQDFQLIVRDDGSTDGTLAMLRDAAIKHPGRVHIVSTEGRLGPRRSFATLLQHTDAHYVAFCDQDDLWLPHKLQRQLQLLQQAEAEGGADLPVLCCSDASVTDANLRVAESSYFAKHRFSVRDGRDLLLPRLLFRNYAIGATTMINAALAKLCRRIPDEAIMHDWWCALVAGVFGRAIVEPQPLILYRQHGANAVGSKRRTLPRSSDEARAQLAWSQASSANCVRQAMAFRAAFGASIPASSGAVLDRFASFPSQSKWRRAATVIGTRAFKPGLALNGLHLYACMTAPL